MEVNKLYKGVYGGLVVKCTTASNGGLFGGVVVDRGRSQYWVGFEYSRWACDSFEEYNGNNIRTMAKDNKLSRTDLLLLSLLGGLIESGLSATRIIDIAGINGNTPGDKSKNKRRIRELIEYATNQDKLAENEIKQRAVNEVLQFMGIYKE